MDFEQVRKTIYRDWDAVQIPEKKLWTLSAPTLLHLLFHKEWAGKELSAQTYADLLKVVGSVIDSSVLSPDDFMAAWDHRNDAKHGDDRSEEQWR